MWFFEKYPRIRLVFILDSILLPFVSVVKGSSWNATLLVFLMFLFYGYIVLVKSEILKNARADAINDLQFDSLSILILAYVLIEIVKFLLIR